ncbi:MAG: hypothetical protein K8R92_07785 [Planctomycetes bacterium]|nr:hypothetical protein [Planctomycetota bacterium]
MPQLLLLYDGLPEAASIARAMSLKAEVWMQINQDAPSYKSGIIDIAAVTKEVESKTGGRPPTWMMLDFEEPFFANLSKGQDSPEYKLTIQTMTECIRAMKARWPESKWTFYGIPNLPYWIEGKGWATAPDDQKKVMLKSMSEAVMPLVRECDWVSVSIYDCYDPSMVVAGSPNSIRGTPASVREDGRAWRMAQVGLAKLLAHGKPVIPNVCNFWVPGGVAPYCRLIQPRAFIEDQIAPAVQAGANGFALWTGINYRISIVTQDEEKAATIVTEKNFGVQDWRKAFTADYFKGKAPMDWTDPQVKQTLVAETSKAIIQCFTNIRAWEKTGVLPPAAP